MTEEIKEILDYLKDKDDYIEKFGYQFKRIGIDHCFQLLDYITNLQQENEKLKYNARGQVNDYFKDKYTDEVLKNAELQKRIDKAIEYIKNNEFYLDYKTGACIKGVIPLLNILNRSGESETNSIIYSDEDVKQENSIESAIEKIWDKMFVDEYFKQLKVLKELNGSDEK